MNDSVKNSKDKQEESVGFTPEPAPPQVEATNAVDLEDSEAVDTSDESAAETESMTVHPDTAKKALEAVQILVQNNREASEQLESLMGIVLDAAEVANRSASAVATTGSQLFKAADKLATSSRKAGMQSIIVLTLAASVLVGTAGTFTFMTIQLNEKVEQVDAMLLAVGKRAVDLKSRMESMDDIHSSLAELNLKQDNTQSVQMAIEDKLSKVVESAKTPQKAAPVVVAAAPAAAGSPGAAAAASPAARKADKSGKSDKSDKADKSDAQAKLLNQQLSGLDALLQEQSQAVKDLSSQLNSVKGAVSNVDGLKKDVETLANLQRQRNQEALQAINTANARREKELKDKERELARERDLLNEREAIRERELAQERAALQAIPAEKTKEKIKDKDRVVQYSREQQSKLNGSGPAPGMPAYTRQAGSQPQ